MRTCRTSKPATTLLCSTARLPKSPLPKYAKGPHRGPFALGIRVTVKLAINVRTCYSLLRDCHPEHREGSAVRRKPYMHQRTLQSLDIPSFASEISPGFSPDNQPTTKLGFSPWDALILPLRLIRRVPLLLRMLQILQQIRIKNRRRNLIIPRSPLTQINRAATIRTKRHIRIIQRNSLLTNRTLQNFGSHSYSISNSCFSRSTV